MTDEERTAILEIVGNMLERLIDRLPDWVPRALDVKEGQKLDVRFSVLFSTLEEQIAATKEVTNRRIREAAEGTAALVEELSRDG